jgi:hypothetical protein
MAKSDTKLQNFLSQIRTQNTPRSDRFEVVFNLPPGLQGSPGFTRSLSVYCEEAQIPGLAATNLPIKIGAWTEYRTQNVEFLTTELSFTFLCDEFWSGREVFEDWIALAANTNSKEVGFYENYVADITVKSLSTQDDVLASWKVIEATPKLINLIPVSWSNQGFIRMSVSFAAKKWERVYDDVGIEPIGDPAQYTDEQKAKSWFDALSGKSDFFSKQQGPKQPNS